MSPTIYRIGAYRFFFNSREESRMHVHVASPDGIAKFWLEPIVSLENFYQLDSRELSRLFEMVKEHEDEFKSAWRRHFSQ